MEENARTPSAGQFRRSLHHQGIVLQMSPTGTFGVTGALSMWQERPRPAYLCPRPDPGSHCRTPCVWQMGGTGHHRLDRRQPQHESRAHRQCAFDRNPFSNDASYGAALAPRAGGGSVTLDVGTGRRATDRVGTQRRDALREHEAVRHQNRWYRSPGICLLQLAVNENLATELPGEPAHCPRLPGRHLPTQASAEAVPLPMKTPRRRHHSAATGKCSAGVVSPSGGRWCKSERRTACLPTRAGA